MDTWVAPSPSPLRRMRLCGLDSLIGMQLNSSGREGSFTSLAMITARRSIAMVSGYHNLLVSWNVDLMIQSGDLGSIDHIFTL